MMATSSYLWALAALLSALGARTPARADAPVTPASGLHVLVINGGGSAADNFASHVAHVRRLLDTMARAGVPKGRITVLASDGADPAPDVAVRDERPEAFWLLEGTRLDKELAPPPHLESTTLPGVAHESATRAALERWFSAAHAKLQPGDTLFIYVTDHGTRNQQDPLENRITLWGDKASISVRQFGALLGRLSARVRVVTLMSQCFSGGFARLHEVRGRGAGASGNTCGYFSTTDDRFAYGCYPEAAGNEEVGHSFAFFDALSRTRQMPAAHARVLELDGTPDVPLRSSDVYLGDLLWRVAQVRRTDEATVVDALLARAWQKRAAWETELRLLDRIGRAFGLPSPRTLKEVRERALAIESVKKEISARRNDWEERFGSTNALNLDGFLAAHPGLAEQVTPRALRNLVDAARGQITARLLPELQRFTEAHGARLGRMTAFADKADLAEALSYRMDVRLAVLERMRTILRGIAGRVLLAEPGRGADAKTHAGLLACEGLTLPGTAVAAGKGNGQLEPFPAFDDDRTLAETVIPGWMGIEFSEAPSARRKAAAVPAAAAFVVRVFPDSPAQVSGLRAGDIVLGPRGQLFSEPREILSWTMLAPVGQPQQLDVLRGAARMQVILTPARKPTDMLKIGPPRVGTAAPALVGQAYRGVLPKRFADAGPQLLYFWATWCGPCKAALPALLAYAERHRVTVVAVTDESREELDRFFAAWKAPFPANVMMDEDRLTSSAYAVSGTPTFVLISGAGKVAGLAVGYDGAFPLAAP